MPGSFVLTLHGGEVTLQTCDETIIALGVALCSFLSGSYVVSKRLAAVSMVIECFAEEAAIYYRATGSSGSLRSWRTNCAEKPGL